MILQKHLSVILGSFLCNDFLLCFVVPKVCKDFAVGQFQLPVTSDDKEVLFKTVAAAKDEDPVFFVDCCE